MLEKLAGPLPKRGDHAPKQSPHWLGGL